MDTPGRKVKKRTQRDYTMGFKLQVVAPADWGTLPQVWINLLTPWEKADLT
ncbi:MAG: hypothetical protein KKD73_07960 [Proteobacteria bacterium]|nr:hypothetical protein [Pseudomonadota bacterium]MBU1639561.1 hypothetical protein [Pseudomonadota bacterium]